MISYLLITINTLIIFFLIFPFITVLLSLFYREKKIKKGTKEFDFACVITAFRNIEICNNLIDSVLKQTYSNYHIYIIADDCDISRIYIESPNLTVLKPERILKSKVKSLKLATDNFVRDHEAVLVLDPDNLCKKDFLTEINKYFNAGYRAVQGKRTAKNLDTMYACLDATGEMYYNYTVKKVPFLLGSSCNIAGSGMAIETGLFKEYLESPSIRKSIDGVILAEDKMLQNNLVGKKLKIAFAQDAILYDEKVSRADAVVRQRTRWLKSYFQNVRDCFQLIIRGVGNFSTNQMLFGLFTIYPPLFLLVVSGLLMCIVNAIVSMELVMIMAGSLGIFAGNFLLVLLLSKAPKQVWKTLWAVPFFIGCQLKAMLMFRLSKKDFLATNHQNFVSIDKLAGE
jgi:cellulose synthase/poly-beta-1,6-N-acetylglucosamine synthase-like glycosyltransferase